MQSIQDNIVQIKENSSKNQSKNKSKINFTQLKNPLLEKLIDFNLSSLQLRLALAVIRQSYGYNQSETINRITKQSDFIEFMPSMKKTRQSTDSIRRAFKVLFDKNVLVKISSKPFKCKININLKEWIE